MARSPIDLPCPALSSLLNPGTRYLLVCLQRLPSTPPYIISLFSMPSIGSPPPYIITISLFSMPSIGSPPPILSSLFSMPSIRSPPILSVFFQCLPSDPPPLYYQSFFNEYCFSDGLSKEPHLPLRHTLSQPYSRHTLLQHPLSSSG